MIRLLWLALYLGFGIYFALAFHRDRTAAYLHDDTDQPPRLLGLLPIIPLWLPLVAWALAAALYRTRKATR